MESLIQILHLEDDPADAELVRARLVEAGLACRIKASNSRLFTAVRSMGSSANQSRIDESR